MMEPFVGIIEKAVPLPHSRRGDGTLRKRMAEMGLKDSFRTNYSITGCHEAAKAAGIKIETRKDTGGHIRVWRIE